MKKEEIVDALQAVRDAKKVVNEALDVASKDDKNLLEELVVWLEKVEGVLISSALDKKIAQLREYEQNLKNVNKQIQKDIKHLKDVSEIIAKVAKALGVLIDIIGKAAALA